jgi:hypothetical protein
VATDSILLKPQVVKTLNRALSALNREADRERNKPPNAGKYWSSEEDAKICEEVRQGIDLHEIAKSHNRSVGSIVTRLVKLGKIAPKASPTQAA